MKETAAAPPGVGFACPADDLHGRVVESFRIELRRAPIADYHPVTIAGRAVAACPLYLKDHSYGEYVFDWAWANAY